jgi:hypothetical protein
MPLLGGCCPARSPDINTMQNIYHKYDHQIFKERRKER